MEFNSTRKKASVEAESMRLYCGDKEIYKIEIPEIIWYSACYPWNYANCLWELRKRKEKEEQVSFCYEMDAVQCNITLGMRQEEIELRAEFVNTGEEDIFQFTGGITLPVLGKKKQKVTIPHLIYNDNPSADPDRIIPHIGGIPGEGVVVEEHRLPIPAVNIEWKEDESYPYLTLLSMPAVVCGNEEEYWSLGVLKETGGERMISTSGPLMFNGMKDVVYGGRCTPLSYMKGYRILRGKERLTKTYYLSWGEKEEEGKGFQSLTDTAYRLLQPQTTPRHSLEQVINYKKMVMDSRYYEDAVCCGYKTFGAANSFGNISGRPEYFLYGWTGQAIKLAWCDCMLGMLTEENFRLDRGMKAADFYVQHGESEVPGLFKGYYVIEQKMWAGDWKNADAGLSSRIEGESICDLIDIMLLLKEHGMSVPVSWEKAVKNVCTFLMNERHQTKEKIYPLEWESDGSVSNHDINAAGMPCVLVLAKASVYFQCEEYLQYAETKYELYADYHMRTFERPFARATMDARCEDKEAGIYFFTTALELFKITGKERFCKWAEIAADWILTFVFFWETGFQKGTVCERNQFKTTGWPGVSVQNHHLDVFFPTYEMYEFGRLSGNIKMTEMALHVNDALTYGICTQKGEWGYTIIGEQGEQYYQTNYFQVRYPALLKYLGNYRGGMQVWNPSWITAQVLSSAIKLYYSKK